MGTIAMMGLKWHYSRTFRMSLSFKTLAFSSVPSAMRISTVFV